MKIMMKNFATTVLVFCLLAVSCSRNERNSKDIKDVSNKSVLEWNEIAYEAFGGSSYQHSLMASRINAMTHIAIHDVLNAIHPVYEIYAFNGKDADADPVAAVASAAHTVLVHEIPAKKTFLDSALQKSIASISDNNAKANGIALGKLAGQAIIDARNNDGSTGELTKQIPPSSIPGVYQAVPPFNFLFTPHWENVRLFALSSKDQFRSAPHPAVNSAEYTAAFNEVKEFGRLKSTARVSDQTGYAKYWYEFSEAGWNRITRIVAADKKMDILETARLFALVNMALADSYIAGWDSKLHYNFWRPYTAIRAAANDGNDATLPDAAWETEEPTPPVQDYPSTHSVLGNAAATVLAKVVGANTSFTMASPTAIPAESTRSFTSFSQAADENADSRVMAGIHFRFSCKAGQEMGDKIGNWIADNYLKPLK